MNDQQLASELEQRNAVVVHFSHHANMREGGTFPEDLQTAIRDRAQWPLSCSVLFPGHSMTPVGSVGVIFKPKVADVVSVSNSDSGSYCGADGVEQSNGRPLDLDSLRQTFNVAGAYNEWRVRSADVVGIFVFNPACIFAKKAFVYRDPISGEETKEIAMQQILLDDVFSAFPGQRVFTLDAGNLVELT